jgi:hypothetical protein
MPDEVRQRLLPAADPRSGTPPSVAGSIASISTNGPSRLQHSASNSSLHAPAGYGGGSYAQDNRSFSSRQDGGHISGSSPLGSPLGSPIGVSGHGGSTFDSLASGASQSSMLLNGSGSSRSRVEPSAMSVCAWCPAEEPSTHMMKSFTVERLRPMSHDDSCPTEQLRFDTGAEISGRDPAGGLGVSGVHIPGQRGESAVWGHLPTRAGDIQVRHPRSAAPDQVAFLPVLPTAWSLQHMAGISSLQRPAPLHLNCNCRDPQSDVPTKVWPLHGRCTLSPLEHKEFTTRGRHSNIVLALATRHVHRKHLVRLNGSITYALLEWESAATWPVLQVLQRPRHHVAEVSANGSLADGCGNVELTSHASQRLIVQWYILLRWPEGHVFSGEPLKLCFEDEEEAECWRDALVTAVSGDLAGQDRTAESRSGRC